MYKERNQMNNKYQKKKSKRRTNHGLFDLLWTIKDQFKEKIQNGTFMVSTKRNYIQKPLMGGLSACNLVHNTTE